MRERKQFRVSSGLKDLIGRDLITDDFVAVFELVKNAFDARASRVRLTFDSDKIIIADNGKGMSRDDILKKWLFVAYSAKKEGTEDDDYRERVGERGRAYAGAKGVGRFSCDRLGAELKLLTRARGSAAQVLEVDWRLYEADATKEFGKIKVTLSADDDFVLSDYGLKSERGTVLEITELRSQWDREKLRKLKRELTKLIDPFAIDKPKFQIRIIAPEEKEQDRIEAAQNALRKEDQDHKLLVNGLVDNPILDVLRKRTTGISVRLIDEGEVLETELVDRGDLVYRIREPNSFEGLAETELRADLYFLNRSAKAVFARRMGLPVVQFGSVFLFRNGFRLFPIGAEHDDFFGLNRRKQQGQKRYLGGRDLIGRVDIKGVEGFDEATSRNQGLIRNDQVQQLIDCVIEKCVRRLERYVVDITWKDSFDTDSSDSSRMRLDESSAKVAELVSRLAATSGVELLEYNPELVRIVDEKSSAFESSLSALELLAEETGDSEILLRVAHARERIRALELAEAEAREAESRAEERARKAEHAASVAEKKATDERERNRFLVAASSLDEDTILNLHHQIIIHASDVHIGVNRMMKRLRLKQAISAAEWLSFLETTSYRNSQILTAARFATKGGYKQQSASIEADLVGYIRDYVETVATFWAPSGLEVQVGGSPEADHKFIRTFKPIEIGILIDNLVSNAKKALADTIVFNMRVERGSKPALALVVSDDGDGWPANSHERVFEKGVTTTDGSGLGLAHVKQVVEGMGGTVIALDATSNDPQQGAHLQIRWTT